MNSMSQENHVCFITMDSRKNTESSELPVNALIIFLYITLYSPFLYFIILLTFLFLSTIFFYFTVLKDLIEEIVMQEKRREQLALVENIFSATRCPPKVCEMGGIHILPGLALRPPLIPKALTVPKKVEIKIQNEGSSSAGGRGTGMGTGMGGSLISTRTSGTSSMNFNAFGQNTTGTSSILGGTPGVTGSRPAPGTGLPPSLKYPTNTPLPRALNPNLSATLKSLYAARGKKGWAGAMWRHTIALVISDIRYVTAPYSTVLLCCTVYCTRTHSLA